MVGAYSVVCWLKSSLKRIMNKNQFGFQNQFLGHQHQFIQSKMFSLKLKFTLYCNESIHTTEPNTQLFQGETKKKKEANFICGAWEHKKNQASLWIPLYSLAEYSCIFKYTSKYVRALL